MALDFAAVIQTLVPSIVTGIVTAFLTLRLALRKHKSESAWEKRFQAYSDLFAALYDIRIHARRRAEEITEGRPFSESYMADLSDRAGAGLSSVRKAAALGIFVFGAEAAELLERLERELDAPAYNMDPVEEYRERLVITTEATASLRILALRDLDLDLPRAPARRGDPTRIAAN